MPNKVPNAFYYSLTALNGWLKHLEERINYFETKSAHFENKSNHLEKLLNNNSMAENKQLVIQNKQLEKLSASETILEEENKVMRKHFQNLKQKYDSVITEKNKNRKTGFDNSSGNFYSNSCVDQIFFSTKLQKLFYQTIKNVLPNEIQANIFCRKEQQELPIWIDIANFIQTSKDPSVKIHEQRCLCPDHICLPKCPFKFSICRLHININTFRSIPFPNSKSSFIRNHGLTFGILLDLGFIKSFKFMGKTGHDKLRNFLGDEHFLARATNYFISKTKTVHTEVTTVPPIWAKEQGFSPAQHNFIISMDNVDWYQKEQNEVITKADYYKWRIYQTQKIAKQPYGNEYKLIAQSSTARYYGDVWTANKIIPFVVIDLTPEEEDIMERLENLQNGSDDMITCLPGESQNDDIDDIDWETMKD